jgi:uncharacterized repeat protein (TIGR01451 family)
VVVPDGTLINFAVEATEDSQRHVNLSRTVVTNGASPFDIAVDEDTNPVSPGQLLTYTISYSNRGTVSATNTGLNFPLPPGVTFVSATAGGALNGNLVQWNLNTFPAGLSGRQKVVVRVNSLIPEGTLLNVDAATISGTVNGLTTTSSALLATRVRANSPMGLALELNPDPVQNGEILNTRLTVTNLTNSDLFGVTLRLRYPESLFTTFNASITDGGTCAGSGCVAGAILTWPLGVLSAGAGRTVSLPPTVNSSSIVAPDGTLIGFDVDATEDNQRRESLHRTVAVNTGSPFDIAVDEDLNPVGPGQLLTYRITYSNRSTTNAINSNVRFPLPTGTSFVSASGGGALSGGAVQWNLNTFPAGSGGRQIVVVQVDNTVAEGGLLNVDGATISGTINSITSTSTALATTRVRRPENSPFGLAIVLTPDPVQRNQVLNTAVTVTNLTNADLFGVTLRLHYPESLFTTFNTNISDGGSCVGSGCVAGSILTWPLGVLSAGASRTVSLPPQVNSSSVVAPDGTLITFNIDGSEDNGGRAHASNTALIGQYVNGPVVTSTPVPTVTATPLPTATGTPLPTATGTPLPTATSTPLPTATGTPLPTATGTPLPTATGTQLPTATGTPLPTATGTPLPTATGTPLPTATGTPLPTATSTPLPTATVTPLPTATSTPLPTATGTPLPTATSTPFPTATVTPLPTATSAPLPTATVTPIPTVIITPVPTVTMIPEPTATPVPTQKPVCSDKGKDDQRRYGGDDSDCEDDAEQGDGDHDPRDKKHHDRKHHGKLDFDRERSAQRRNFR